MRCVGTFIFGRPRPLSQQRRADYLYTLICEEPDFLVTETGTNLSLLDLQFESEEGTPTFGNAGLSSATPRRAAVTGLASQYVVSQQATGIERATPDHRLEEHGCRPRPPGHIQQVGIETVLAEPTKAGNYLTRE
jgi:hypothetical protein